MAIRIHAESLSLSDLSLISDEDIKLWTSTGLFVRGCNSPNPVTGEDTGRERPFLLINTVDLKAGVAQYVQIAPGLILSGHYRNTVALPEIGAEVGFNFEQVASWHRTPEAAD
jgi:hypothetical protein